MRPRQVRRKLIRKAQKLMDKINRLPKDSSEYEQAIDELTNLYVIYGSLIGTFQYVTIDKED